MARTVLTNAQVLTGVDPLAAGQTVVIEGERIAAVTDSPIEPQPGERRIDLAGRTVMPGLISSHFHSSYDNITVQPEPLGLEKPPGYLTLVAARNLRLALDCGFTGLISAGAINDNIDPQCRLAIEDGVIEGPRLMPGGRGLDTTGGYTDSEKWWWRLGNSGAQLFCNGEDEFRAGVREEIKRGVRIIKLFPSGGHAAPESAGGLSISLPEMRAACDAAHQRGAKVRAHAPWKEAILACVEAGVDIIDHGDNLDDECLDAMLRAGSILAPSAFFTHQMLQDTGNLVDASPAQMAPIQAEHDNICRLLPKVQAAGLKLVAGDDYGIVILPHGRYAEEFEFYVKTVGISPLEVLTWATQNGADAMGLGDELGSVTVSKRADLLVIDGDPSVDIALLQDREKICAIIQDGRFYKDAL